MAKGGDTYRLYPEVPAREMRVAFDPVTAAATRRLHPTRTTIGGSPPQSSVRQPSAAALLQDPKTPFSLQSLPVRDPDSFVAGQLHQHAGAWDKVLDGHPEGDMVRAWLGKGVDVSEFFRPFKGNFAGRSWDSNVPPTMFFQNPPH